MIERTQGSDALAHYRHPEDHHAFIPGGTRPGKDGRVMQICGAAGCDKPKNAGRHRPASAVVHRAAAANLHPFVVGGPTRLNKAGVVIHLCGDPACRKAQNSPAHWTENRSRLAVSGTRQGTGRRQSPMNSAAPSRTRRARSVAPQEYVLLAMAMDSVLALPPDTVGWRLRMRIVAVRELLDVPTHPSLAAPAEPEPEPDPQEAADTASAETRLGPRLAQYAPVMHRDAQAQSIIRGMRSDRGRTLVKRAHQQGWDVSTTGSGHVRLSKGDQTLIVSSTADGGRRGHSWGNLRAQAKRVGLDVTGL